MATTSMVASLPTLTSLHSNRNRWASVNIIKATASEKERSEGVKLSGGVGYLSKVILTSPHGSEAEIYLFGACLTSWKNPIGKDLLFVRPDAGSDGQKPISGGLPHCFSQFGPGKIRQHGFVRNTNWSLVESESVEGKPVVTFELKDAPYSCSMWDFSFQALYKKLGRVLMSQLIISLDQRELPRKCSAVKDRRNVWSLRGVTAFSSTVSWLISSQVAYSATEVQMNPIYEVGELFELGIQLSYLLLLLALLGAGTFFVIRQVLVRRELDLSAKELQEQVRSGDANATELFELGAVMLRRKFYPAATKFLLQAIDKWDGDDQDLAQVYNALGVSYVRDDKLEKGIGQFEYAVKLQPGYVTAWNNLGDAYEKKKDLTSALKAFEEVLLFDPNNKVARPRVDSLRDRINMYKGVPVKSKERRLDNNSI